MRESTVEQFLVAMVRAAGGLCPKFVSPARRSVPDRIALHEIPPEHRAIVARYIQLIECKAPGEKPTAAQLREHARLRALGFRVEVVDSPQAVEALMRGITKRDNQ